MTTQLKDALTTILPSNVILLLNSAAANKPMFRIS